MKIPTIHLNGTSADRLLDDINNAYAKIGEAISALAQTAPNGRDYYPQGNGALEQAQNEHHARISKLVAIKAEVEQIVEGIDAQEVR